MSAAASTDLQTVLLAGASLHETGWYRAANNPVAKLRSRSDVCGGVGTIFSILRHDPHVTDAQGALLQPGREQVAARYVLYGSSTVFVLDPAIGAFMLVERGLRTPVILGIGDEVDHVIAQLG